MKRENFHKNNPVCRHMRTVLPYCPKVFNPSLALGVFTCCLLSRKNPSSVGKSSFLHWTFSLLKPLEIIEERRPLNWAPRVLGPQASLTLCEKKSQQLLPLTWEGDARWGGLLTHWFFHLLSQCSCGRPLTPHDSSRLISVYKGFQGDRAKEFSLEKTTGFGPGPSES